MNAWIPHQGKQEAFCSAGEFEVLYGGAAGPGKTDCLIALATRHIRKPGYKGLILRRTFPQLQEIIDRTWAIYPSLGGVYRSGEHRWHFPAGSTIAIGHMQHEDDKYNYHGQQYHFIGWDELTQFSESQYLYLFSRCRTIDPEIPTRFRATTNPGGIGHVWVKRRFVDACPPEKMFIDPITGLSRRFIPGQVYDNPTLVDSDPGYVKRLEALPDVEKRRLLHGDWSIFEGQAFPELSKLVHGIAPFQVPPEWERYMVLDWGYAKPFSCGWYAVDYDDNLYRYREYYGCKQNETDEGLRMTAQEVAVKINELERGEKIRGRLADPSIWHARPGFRQKEAIGPTINDDFMGQGVFFLKADNDRLQGIHQLHRRLKVEQFVKDTGEIVETPSFYAFNDQVHFWRTMPEILVDPKNPDDIDTKQEDHICDEVRYMCMFRPVKPKRVEMIPPGSFMHERNRLIKAKKYAAKHGISLSQAYQRMR